MECVIARLRAQFGGRNQALLGQYCVWMSSNWIRTFDRDGAIKSTLSVSNINTINAESGMKVVLNNETITAFQMIRMQCIIQIH